MHPDEILQDPVQEQTAREVFKDVRCPVCTHQSLLESDAGLSKDLRNAIRQQVVAGKSQKEIHIYLTDRYGQEILLKPPVNSSTYILWGLPVVIFIVAGYILGRKYSKG